MLGNVNTSSDTQAPPHGSNVAAPSDPDPTGDVQESSDSTLKLRETIFKILDTHDLGDLSLKMLRRLGEKELGLDKKALDVRRGEIKEIFMEYTRSKNSAVVDSYEKSSSKQEEAEAQRPAKRSRLEKQVSHNLQTLTKLVRIARKGPRIYSGLPSDPEEKVKALSDALKAAGKSHGNIAIRLSWSLAGVEFEGLVPTPAEMAEIKREADKARDLEGIDTSNIISNDSRRRRRTTAVRYVEEDEDDQEEDSEGRDDDSDGSYSESEEQAKKTARNQKENKADAINKGDGESEEEEDLDNASG